MENLCRYVLGLDLGKIFGYAIYDRETKTFVESGELEDISINEPWELTSLIQSKINSYGAGKIELVVEWGQGFMSKQAWRGFGISQWTTSLLANGFGVKLTKYTIQGLWGKHLKNLVYVKTNENDAIELVKYHLAQEEREKQNGNY